MKCSYGLFGAYCTLLDGHSGNHKLPTPATPHDKKDALPRCPLCGTPMVDKFHDGTIYACYYGSSSHALEFVGNSREQTLERIRLAAPAAALAEKDERITQAEALIRRMGVELCYANSGAEIPPGSAEGEGLIHDAEQFIGRPVRHWAEASDLPPWEKKFVCGHEKRADALQAELTKLRHVARSYSESFETQKKRADAAERERDEARKLLVEAGSWAWYEGFTRLANSINNLLRRAADNSEIEYPFSHLHRMGPDDEPWVSDTEEKLKEAEASRSRLLDALRDCIKAMDLWASDEDGVHPEAYPLYVAAKKLAGDNDV